MIRDTAPVAAARQLKLVTAWAGKMRATATETAAPKAPLEMRAKVKQAVPEIKTVEMLKNNAQQKNSILAAATAKEPRFCQE